MSSEPQNNSLNAGAARFSEEQDPSATVGAGPVRHQRRREHRRNYQACVLCRKQKTRCNLGSPENPQPPCSRCRRARKECVFEKTRSRVQRPTNGDGAAHGAPNDYIGQYSSRPEPPNGASAHFDVYPTAIRRPESLQNGAGLLPSHVRTDERYDGEANGAGHMDTPMVDPASSDLRYHSRQEPGPADPPHSPVNDRLINTIVRNPSDALHLLFDAAQQSAEDFASNRDLNGNRLGGERRLSARDGNVDAPAGSAFRPANAQSCPSASSPSFSIASAPEETQLAWMQFRLCREGCLKPQEAIYLLNYFFTQLNPISPILTDYYWDPANHKELLLDDSTLCTTILAITSRYADLPGHGGHSRGYLIHSTLFRQVQMSIQRTIWGADEETPGRKRNLGVVESLLLLTEWQPRAIHFPPDWSSMYAPVEIPVLNPSAIPPRTPEENLYNDIVKPIRRADKMAWMLMGNAITLALELGVFDEVEEIPVNPSSDCARRLRLRKLLFVYSSQVASRIGRPCPIHNNYAVSAAPAMDKYLAAATSQEKSWHQIVDSWNDLVRLGNVSTDMLFSSPSQTKTLIHKGKYIGVIDHLMPLLSRWWATFTSNSKMGEIIRYRVEMEYCYVKVYIHSIAIQAVLERSLPALPAAELPTQPYDPESLARFAILNPAQIQRDLSLIREVVTGSRRILEIGLELHRQGYMRNGPVIILLRVVTACMFILKILGLNLDEETGLIELLLQVSHMLHVSGVDDLHLSTRYASLLETLISKIQKRPVRTRGPTRAPSPSDQRTHPSSRDEPSGNTSELHPGGTPLHPQQNGGEDEADLDAAAENVGFSTDWNEWLAFQFDPSLAALNMGLGVDMNNA